MDRVDGKVNNVYYYPYNPSRPDYERDHKELKTIYQHFDRWKGKNGCAQGVKGVSVLYFLPEFSLINDVCEEV